MAIHGSTWQYMARKKLLFKLIDTLQKEASNDFFFGLKLLQ